MPSIPSILCNLWCLRQSNMLQRRPTVRCLEVSSHLRSSGLKATLAGNVFVFCSRPSLSCKLRELFQMRGNQMCETPCLDSFGQVHRKNLNKPRSLGNSLFMHQTKKTSDFGRAWSGQQGHEDQHREPDHGYAEDACLKSTGPTKHGL